MCEHNWVNNAKTGDVLGCEARTIILHYLHVVISEGEKRLSGRDCTG